MRLEMFNENDDLNLNDDLCIHNAAACCASGEWVTEFINTLDVAISGDSAARRHRSHQSWSVLVLVQSS